MTTPSKETYEWIYAPPDAVLGRLILTFTPHGLSGLDFVDVAPIPQAIPGGFPPAVKAYQEMAASALGKYFAGRPTDFSYLPLALRGTAFQLRVWHELRQIPWGRTISYGELAARLGKPQAPRAVGQAVGTNPVAIIIPCHRVVAADGTLGGYGGGLERKRWLLLHEGGRELPGGWGK
jgi:methylated-DNA-[protein]-cysteine S-methyltransferase